MEIGAVAADHRQGDDQEHGERGHLDDDEDGVERRALLRADHQKRRDESDDQDRGQVEDAADLAALEEAQVDRRSDLRRAVCALRRNREGR